VPRNGLSFENVKYPKNWLSRICRAQPWWINTMAEHDKCGRTEKLNMKVRVNKGQLADHDLWHSDQATVDLTLRVAGLDDKN
jgi:hypothetical protein